MSFAFDFTPEESVTATYSTTTDPLLATKTQTRVDSVAPNITQKCADSKMHLTVKAVGL